MTRLHVSPSRLRSWLLIAAALAPAVATAQAQYPVSNIVSVCVDPPQPSVVVRNEVDKARHPGCVRWSSFAGTSALLGAMEFRHATCEPAVPAVNRFAARVVATWTGKPFKPSALPTSRRLRQSPGAFHLRDVGAAESRVGALAVWRGAGGDGMVALVVADDTPRGAPAVDLRRVTVLYPSATGCGELKVLDALTLADSLAPPRPPRFLTLRQPLFYWNHWIADADGTGRPTDVVAGRSYVYRVDFSTLDYGAVNDPGAAREVFSEAEAASSVPAFDDYKVSILPIGQFSDRGSTRAKVLIDRSALTRALTARQIGGKAPAELAATYGALKVVGGDGTPAAAPGVRHEFSVDAPGCAALAVVVWREQTRRIVAAWIESFPVQAADGDTPPPACPRTGQAAWRMDLTAVPRLSVAGDTAVDARLTFLDFGNYTLGTFEDLAAPGAIPLTWVLEHELKRHQAKVVRSVDRGITDNDFELATASAWVRGALFSCRDAEDQECPGEAARRRIVELARQAPGAVTIEAVFRDIANSQYYLPLHLLELARDAAGGVTVLGQRARIVQPLPIPAPPPRPVGACVRTWTAGLIVRDEPAFDRGDWRLTWIAPFKRSESYRSAAYTTLPALRNDYFRRMKPAPTAAEGLVILAHHADGEMADVSESLEADRIQPENVKRTFVPGSFAVLAACSVGGMGDSTSDNSRMLHALNGQHIRAAIVSPFKVHPKLARRFLDHFRDAVLALEQDATLHEVFEAAKARLATTEPSLGLRAAVHVLMVVGDGSVRICKP